MLQFHNFDLFYNPQIYETYREIQTQSLDEKKRISYLCIEIVLLIMRELIYSPDYLEFEKNSSPRTLEKIALRNGYTWNCKSDSEQVCKKTNQHRLLRNENFG